MKNLTTICLSLTMLMALGLGGCAEREEQPSPKATGGSDQATTQPAGPSAAPAENAEYMQTAGELADGGVEFLLAARNDQGGWGFRPGSTHPALTAMVLKCLLQHPDYSVDDSVVSKGFDALRVYQQDDGGIYDPEQGQYNYTTAVAVMAMAAAEDPRFDDEIDKAIGYMKSLQFTPGSVTADGVEVTAEHPFRGGVSYGHHNRPDLSNVGFWMQAMNEAGVSGDDPAVQEALIFVTRTQNLSETNERPWAQVGVSDGGFIYAPAIRADFQAGESKAGEGPGGRGLRSYGSMTYTGFKSLLYAGVDRDDPRVKAAWDWIRTYWRLDSNPNMPQQQNLQGLYYYYHVFAKALRAWGEPVITDKDGEGHNWRQELTHALAERVNDNGSWTNQADRWFESHPVLATCYAVMALQEALGR